MICYKDYHTIQGYECLSACITNYFNYLGLSISGSDIFFVGCGFVITYEKNERAYIGAKLYESNFMFLKNMNIPFQHTKLEESKNVIKFLRKSIEDEQLIAIKVSSECLEHNRVFKQTEGSPHYVNILGYDDSTNKVFISDGYVPTFNPTVFEGWVDTNGIIEAWRRMDYEYVKLDLVDIKISTDEIHRIAIMNMKFGIQQYLNPSKQRLSTKVLGEDAIKKLFEDILLMFDMPIDLKKVALDINYQLKIYGFITSKRFILQKLINLKMKECYLGQYSKIIDKWNQICMPLVKAGISRNKKSFELTLKKVNESIHEEENVLHEILNELGYKRGGVVMNDKIIEKAVSKYGTPLYLYDMDNVGNNLKELQDVIMDSATVYYSMKANPLLGICQYMKENSSGIEVASKGELFIALHAGFSPENIIFTSPGKTVEEIRYAIENRIKLINIDSIEEARIINQEARAKNFIMPIAIRVNPRVSFANAKIKMSGVASQFGIEEEALNESLFSELQKLTNISLIGIQVYMGTQILNAEDLVKNTEYIIELALSLSEKYSFSLQYLNMGGGFGIPYFPNETELDMRKLKSGFSKLDEIYAEKLANTELIFESGRYIMAEAGVFVIKALYCKESKGNSYIVCDGGSNFHGASAFLGRFVRNNYPMHVVNSKESKTSTNVTGPLCTPSDIIGQKVSIGSVSVGDIIVIEKSGAYGLTHSPLKFLSHEAPAEVIFHGEQYHVLREREKVDSFLLGQNALYRGNDFE